MAKQKRTSDDAQPETSDEGRQPAAHEDDTAELGSTRPERMLEEEASVEAKLDGAENLEAAEAVEAEAGASEEAGPPGEDDEAQRLAEVEQLSAQAAEYLEGWQRARAEFANYKKRVDREMQEAYQRAVGDVIARYLPVLDDLERALKDRPEGEETGRWAEGIELIYKKLKIMLDAEGVTRIEAQGQPFDPSLHEAISYEESELHQEGIVIDVVQHGYRMGERVLRPALVRVAK